MRLFKHENLPQVQKLARELLLCTCRVMSAEPVGDVTFESNSRVIKPGMVGYIVKARTRAILRHPDTGEIYKCHDLEINASTSSIMVYHYDSKDAERYCNASNSAHAQHSWIAYNLLPDDTIAKAAALMKSEKE